MRNRKIRRFRHRPNGRGFQNRNDVSEHVRLGSSSFVNGRSRNNFKTQQSAEKLVEKYNALAKEAISLGDKTLAENYLQHIDHFERIVSHKNLNQNNNLSNNSETDRDHINKNKE